MGDGGGQGVAHLAAGEDGVLAGARRHQVSLVQDPDAGIDRAAAAVGVHVGVHRDPVLVEAHAGVVGPVRVLGVGVQAVAVPLAHGIAGLGHRHQHGRVAGAGVGARHGDPALGHRIVVNARVEGAVLVVPLPEGAEGCLVELLARAVMHRHLGVKGGHQPGRPQGAVGVRGEGLVVVQDGQEAPGGGRGGWRRRRIRGQERHGARLQHHGAEEDLAAGEGKVRRGQRLVREPGRGGLRGRRERGQPNHRALGRHAPYTAELRPRRRWGGAVQTGGRGLGRGPDVGLACGDQHQGEEREGAAHLHGEGSI